jgi:hypothetical protein
MALISKENDWMTLIYAFTVEPENRQRPADLLIKATEKTIKGIPG